MKTNQTLMLIATIGTFGLLYCMMFRDVPKDNVTVLLAIVGPLLGFYFGSSVNKQSVAPPPPAPTTISDLINQAALDAVKKGGTP